MEPKTMTLKLTDKQLETWRNIAKQSGFTILRGKMIGSGSVQQLMVAVAEGEYRIAVWPASDGR